MKRRLIEKSVLACIALVTVVSFAACGKEDTKNQATNTPTVTEAVSEVSTSPTEEAAVSPTEAVSQPTETPVPTATVTPVPQEKGEISIDNLESTLFSTKIFKYENGEFDESVYRVFEVTIKTPPAVNCSLDSDKWKYYDGEKIQQLQIKLGAEYKYDKQAAINTYTTLYPETVLVNENGYFIYYTENYNCVVNIFTPESDNVLISIECNYIRGTDRKYTESFWKEYEKIFMESIVGSITNK